MIRGNMDRYACGSQFDLLVSWPLLSPASSSKVLLLKLVACGMCFFRGFLAYLEGPGYNHMGTGID